MAGTSRPDPRLLAPPPSGVGQRAAVDTGGAEAITAATSSPSPIVPNGGDASGPGAAKSCATCGHRYPADFKLCPRDGTELELVDADDDDDLVGSTLGGTYTLVRAIGEGGMGRVYEARHHRIRTKRYAVKVLHPEYARQPDVLSRFQREAEAAAAIDSPFVVDVYDVDRTADGRPYIVGEFLSGVELAEHLGGERMEVGPAVRILRHVCKALTQAHAQGVIHRDMKPENIFLVGDLRRPIAKVIDFGISKVATGEGGTSLTKTGMIMGTPSYMSPEQARGDKVDERADIYAVGAILYCMLTGRRPFERGDPTATLTAVLTEDPERPRVLVPSIPETLELVIQRAMAKLPDDRYQSMEELDTDLALFDVDVAEPDPSGADALTSAFPKSLPQDARRGAAASLDRQIREASMARPMIVLMTGLGAVWLSAAVMTLLGGILRVLHEDPVQALSIVEAGLLMGFALLALLSPLAVLIRHLRSDVWANQQRALSTSETLTRYVTSGLVVYGFGAVLIRLLEAVILRHPLGIAWPYWDIILGAASIIGALGTGLVARSRRR